MRACVRAGERGHGGGVRGWEGGRVSGLGEGGEGCVVGEVHEVGGRMGCVVGEVWMGGREGGACVRACKRAWVRGGRGLLE